MAQNNLDDHIKQALENLQAAYQDGHWELMQQKLNDSVNSDLAERPEDHAFRQKLSQIKPEAQPEHWDLMAAKLAALSTEPILEDALVDGVAYENLKDLQVPYEKEHWDIMEEKIERELHWSNSVVRYKLVELALAFLFVFTFFQYWPNAKSIIPNLIKQHETPNAADQKEIDLLIAILDGDMASEEVETSESTVENENSAKQFATEEIITDNTTLETLAEENPAPIALATPIIITPSETATSIVEEDRSFSVFAPISSIESSVESGTIVDKFKADKSAIATEDRSNYLFNDFALLANQPEYPLANPDFDLPDCNDCHKTKIPSYLRIGMMAMGSFDLISNEATPSSTLNRRTEAASLSNVQTGAFGFGGGLTIGLKSNHWEFESGIGYGSKFINPKYVSVTLDRGNLLEGYSGYGWVGSQIDLLQIPISGRYDFVKKPNWKLYGQSGMTFNLAINAIDRYADYHVKPLNNPRNDQRSPANEVTSREDALFISNNEGIAKGGSIVSNSFAHVNLGFGIERQFSSRYSFFVQPNYHYFLGKGFKNSDLKIHSASIQTGFKVSLKKKSRPGVKSISGNGGFQTIQLKK